MSSRKSFTRKSKRNIKLLDASQLGRLVDLVESVFE